MRWLDIQVQRRMVLKGAGALVVSGVTPRFIPDAAAADRPLWRPLSPGQLDTYLKISEDGVITALTERLERLEGLVGGASEEGIELGALHAVQAGPSAR